MTFASLRETEPPEVTFRAETQRTAKTQKSKSKAKPRRTERVIVE
jgi:hypothetical protein